MRASHIVISVPIRSEYTNNLPNGKYSRIYILLNDRISGKQTIGVVSYRVSTSNHNDAEFLVFEDLLYFIEFLHQTTTFSLRLVCSCMVVFYRVSTSNHNCRRQRMFRSIVVFYRVSTSNHNPNSGPFVGIVLYFIEFLHQTTTCNTVRFSVPRCIL